MRILYCVASLRYGGAERRCLLLSREVAKLGHEVRLICAEAPGELAARCDRNVELVSLDHRGRFLPRGLMPLHRAIRDYQPDVFQGFVNVGAYYGAVLARRAGVPAVISSIGTNIDHRPWAEVRLAHLCLRWPHTLQVNSQGLYQYYHTRWDIPEARLAMVPNFVIAAEFPYRDAAVRQQVRRELNIPEEALVIGHVGRMEAVKAHKHMLTAAAMGLPAVWLFAGGGPLQEQLLAQAEELRLGDRVRFLGIRTDVPRLLQAMDIFTLPSLSEGMPNALLEAMSCGLPAVGTKVSGTSELILAGKTGWLIPPDDPEALHGALLEACRDRDRLVQYGQAAREQIEQHYDLPRGVDLFVRLYEEILGQRRHGADPSSLRTGR